MLRKEKGFTLIELLIVIAIIGILAAIAIPMYRTQTIKAKLTEVTNAMSNVASAVAAYHQESESTGSVWPNCTSVTEIMSSLGVSLGALSRIAAMTVDSTDGFITATIANGIDQNTVDGSNLVLTPSLNSDGSIQWQWSGSVPAAFIPRR
jgi:type IV pilus assembly protein PilA